jgi:hypothetical protein
MHHKIKKNTYFLTNYETNNITKGCFLNVAILATSSAKYAETSTEQSTLYTQFLIWKSLTSTKLSLYRHTATIICLPCDTAQNIPEGLNLQINHLLQSTDIPGKGLISICYPVKKRLSLQLK